MIAGAIRDCFPVLLCLFYLAVLDLQQRQLMRVSHTQQPIAAGDAEGVAGAIPPGFGIQ
jgi:hypothetical protein